MHAIAYIYNPMFRNIRSVYVVPPLAFLSTTTSLDH